MARRKTSSSTLIGKIRAQDPFELIRWLAMSQPDPRKALAELVQNSLDAGAASVRVKRVRLRGVPMLRVYDDGEGVIPELPRPEALRYVATHIGHSRKRSLSPQERMQLMTQGQYGIGLLGFWSIGEQLEIRSAVPGQAPMRLVLTRDSSEFRIEKLRGRLALDERWTEVVISDVHRDALPVLVGRRAADYLSAELRGQLLARSVDLVFEDRMARGTAQKVIPVRPPRFLGERLDGIGPLEVAGHPPIALELYLGGEEGSADAGRVGVYCAGTLVAESFLELGNLGLDHSPWTDSRLSGLVDFPGLRVSPGTRRGVVPDDAAGAFARALDALAPTLEAILERDERLREIEKDRNLVRDLQRAFRGFYRDRPRYAMLPVREPDQGVPASSDNGAGEGSGVAEPEPDLDRDATASDDDLLELLRAGPLHAVAISPTPVRVECSGTRQVRARALDARGRPVTESVQFEWSLEARIATLELDPARPRTAVLTAGDLPGSGTLRVVARQGSLEESATGTVLVLEELPSRRSGEGIPDPEFVHAPGAAWRSRVLNGQWQVNSGHREYRALVDRPALKLRYLAMLFAKEIVVRSHQDPRLEAPLEALVEVASYADRTVADRRGGKRARRRSKDGEG